LPYKIDLKPSSATNDTAFDSINALFIIKDAEFLKMLHKKLKFCKNLAHNHTVNYMPNRNREMLTKKSDFLFFFD